MLLEQDAVEKTRSGSKLGPITAQGLFTLFTVDPRTSSPVQFLRKRIPHSFLCMPEGLPSRHHRPPGSLGLTSNPTTWKKHSSSADLATHLHALGAIGRSYLPRLSTSIAETLLYTHGANLVRPCVTQSNIRNIISYGPKSIGLATFARRSSKMLTT
jgi:hypothetical protein